ncbi:MAG: hypothetical protein HOY71_12250 [Nonomuraea sp.]|nr:hypothetical protein [Nonomuraea sp.]
MPSSAATNTGVEKKGPLRSPPPHKIAVHPPMTSFSHDVGIPTSGTPDMPKGRSPDRPFVETD